MEWKWVKPTALALAGFTAQRVTQTVLDGFYARSGYPVPYYEGQLSFSADKLAGWYSAMQADGTLGIYWQTQFVDFAFVAATLFFFTALLSAVARALPPESRARHFARRMLWVGAAAPLLDILENLLSFLMLPNPSTISPTIAILYSTAAALKFACFIAVYLWTVIGLLTALTLRLRTRFRPAPAH